jgi:hypothetical protein
LQVDTAVPKPADTNLWALKVNQYPNVALVGMRAFTYSLSTAALDFGITMREI